MLAHHVLSDDERRQLEALIDFLTPILQAFERGLHALHNYWESLSDEQRSDLLRALLRDERTL